MGERWPETAYTRLNPYKEYQPGDVVGFTIHTFTPDGHLALSDQSIVVEEVRGGGFFGKVLVPKEQSFVVKTSLPDPWHHLWRLVNWGFRPFPAQTEEPTAQLEHVSTKLIHLALPVLSKGKFRSPDSFGYTNLPTGFAQVVEKMEGRGPRFDLDRNEYQEFRQAQRELTALAARLGLEQLGQVHPDNPFAMANLWYDPQKQSWIWLDTTPAIPHNGWIWPWYHFPFHKEIRHWFYQKETTFGQIHTGYFLTEINNNRHLFTEEQYQEITSYLKLYNDIHGSQLTQHHKDFAQVADALGYTARDLLTERAIYKLLADPAFRQERMETLVRIIRDPQYRTYYFNKNFVLAGMEQAKEKGIITEEEWQQAWQVVKNNQDGNKDKWRKPIVLTSLQIYYLLASAVINAIEGSVYLSAIFEEDKLARAGLGVFIGRVLPLIILPSSTAVTALVSGLDLKVATIISAIPFWGKLLAVPAQWGATESARSRTIWHYTVRNIIAGLSHMKGIIPYGGWGTQLEAELWQKLGPKIEKLGNTSPTRSN